MDLDGQDTKKMETTVRAVPGRQGGHGDPEVGEQGDPATKNLLGWGDEIKVRDIGFSVFGFGLQPLLTLGL